MAPYRVVLVTCFGEQRVTPLLSVRPQDHSCRSEDLSLARTLDNKAAEAWVGHPYFDVMDNSCDFDTKIRRTIAVGGAGWDGV